MKPTGSRARIYNRDGALILDSDTFYSRGEVLRYDLPPPDAEKPDALTSFWQAVKTHTAANTTCRSIPRSAAPTARPIPRWRRR